MSDLAADTRLSATEVAEQLAALDHDRNDRYHAVEPAFRSIAVVFTHWTIADDEHDFFGPLVRGIRNLVTDLGPSPGSAGRLFAYDTRTGRLAWQFGDGKYATPIAAAGRLVVSGATHVYVLRPRAPR